MYSVPNGSGKTKVIIQLDKSLSKQYSNEKEYIVMDIRLTVAVSSTVIAQVSTLGNAAVLSNANLHHEVIQENNWNHQMWSCN